VEYLKKKLHNIEKWTNEDRKYKSTDAERNIGVLYSPSSFAKGAVSFGNN
tara:strand:- start:408 stop:557 length:150 start_codon:yes stop_codon:yes gene_type:complete